MDDPAADFDGPWKQALEWYFGPFLAFFFPTIHGEIDWNREPEFLDKELQAVLPETVAGRGTVDKLAKVWTLAGTETWVLVHVEIQSQHDAAFSERMYRYNHRLEDRYGTMPVSLAVLGDKGSAWRPDAHRAGRWGCDVQFTFPAVKLLDYSNREAVLEAEPNPFAAVTLAHLKTLETHGNPDGRRGWKVRLVKGLYDRGLSRVQVIRLFRLIEKMMTLPPVPQTLYRREMEQFEKEKQMPFITPLEQTWLEEGIAKGLLLGRLDTIRLGLKLRFGQPGLDLLPRVRAVTELATLDAIVQAIETAPNLDAIRQLLPPEAPANGG